MLESFVLSTKYTFIFLFFFAFLIQNKKILFQNKRKYLNECEKILYRINDTVVQLDRTFLFISFGSFKIINSKFYNSYILLKYF